MKNKVILVTIMSSLLLTSCADLSMLNKKIGDVAGELNSSLYGKKGKTSSTEDINSVIKSKRSVDSVYARVKRQLAFETQEEAIARLGDDSGLNYWKMNGLVHTAQPGSYYKMSKQYFEQSGSLYFEVTIEKNGSGANVYYVASGPKNLIHKYVRLLKNAVK